MNSITKLRFNSIAGYFRHPILPLVARELGWYEEANEKVLGMLTLDRSDLDFGYYILGRDARGRFRAVEFDSSISTFEKAHAQLVIKLAEYAQMQPAELYQGDEVGRSLDFFTPLVEPEKRHPNFQAIITAQGMSPARDLLNEMMYYFEDVDGNFVEQFQTTGFNARCWELYLYALFTELGYAFDRGHAAPDFHLQGLLDEFFVEATTVNPSDIPPKLDASKMKDYYEQYVPMKFGSALFSKLKKQYWKLAHVAGYPLVLAVQDFHAPQSMSWSNAALVEYLYGVRQVEQKTADGSMQVVSEQVGTYVWEGKEVPSGFFFQSESENISAVLANPSGTISMFNRMGFLAGFGDRALQMIRRGFCYRDLSTPEEFTKEVHSADYDETWSEGISIYHNPKAIVPLSASAIPHAAHYYFSEGRILSEHPPFHPLGSITFIVPTG